MNNALSLRRPHLARPSKLTRIDDQLRFWRRALERGHLEATRLQKKADEVRQEAKRLEALAATELENQAEAPQWIEHLEGLRARFEADQARARAQTKKTPPTPEEKRRRLAEKQIREAESYGLPPALIEELRRTLLGDEG